MHNDIKLNGEFAEKLQRIRIGDDTKRRIVINAKVLYDLMELHNMLDFKTFCDAIDQSPLRENIDYQYTKTKDSMHLTICAMQAILVIHNTEQSWKLHHNVADLIKNGFRN